MPKGMEKGCAKTSVFLFLCFASGDGFARRKMEASDSLAYSRGRHAFFVLKARHARHLGKKCSPRSSTIWKPTASCRAPSSPPNLCTLNTLWLPISRNSAGPWPICVSSRKITPLKTTLPFSAERAARTKLLRANSAPERLTKSEIGSGGDSAHREELQAFRIMGACSSHSLKPFVSQRRNLQKNS